MPRHKIIKKDILDRFYTNPTIAKQCYDVALRYIPDNILLVEPSAGSGSFYNIFRSPKIGYDLFPQTDAIISGNWFDQSFDDNIFVVGNPPYGERNKLTDDFITHCIQNNSIGIAFILPMVYRKETKQNIFPQNWALVEDVDIPPVSFILDNKPYHIPATFQVWLKDYSLKNLRESIRQKHNTTDFEFVKKNDDPDYFIFGAAPHKIISPTAVNDNNRGYYIKSNIENMPETFCNIDWKKYSLSSVNGGVAWFTKQQIIDAYIAETLCKGNHKCQN
jgi:hypothetical protein